MSDFSGTASILIDRPEILEIYVKSKGKPKKWDKYSEAEKKAFSFFILQRQMRVDQFHDKYSISHMLCSVQAFFRLVYSNPIVV
jgi:hypothetical protein